jgi:predicted ATPase
MRIVLTGAPGSGKTTLVRQLAAEQPGIVAVAEAATHVYSELGKRWDQLDDAGRREVQRAIYRHQVESEAAATGEVVLLDRGTVDGAAYWPDGADAYWQDLETTHAAELVRYDAVILLESAAAVGAYDGPASNEVRFEDAEAALTNGRLLAMLWADHPRRCHIAATAEFTEKRATVRAVLADLIR